MPAENDTSACCVSQIDRVGAGAEKTALATGPISSTLSGWMEAWGGWGGGALGCVG